MKLFAKGKGGPAAPSAAPPAFQPIDRNGLLGLLDQVVNSGQTGLLELQEPRGEWAYAFQAGALTHASGGRVRGARQAFDLLWEFQQGQYRFTPGTAHGMGNNLYIDKARLVDLLRRSQAAMQGPASPYIPPDQQRQIPLYPTAPVAPNQAWGPPVQQVRPGVAPVPQAPPQAWPPAGYPQQPQPGYPQPTPVAGYPPVAPGQPAVAYPPGYPPQAYPGQAPGYPSQAPYGAPYPPQAPMMPQPPAAPGMPAPQMAPPMPSPPQMAQPPVAPTPVAVPSPAVKPPSFSVPPMPIPPKTPAYQAVPPPPPPPPAQPVAATPTAPTAPAPTDDLRALRASLVGQAPPVPPKPQGTWAVRAADGTTVAPPAARAKGAKGKKKGPMQATIELQLIKFLLWACERKYLEEDHWTLKDAFEVSTMELRDQFFSAFSQQFKSTPRAGVLDDDADDLNTGRMRGRAKGRKR